MDVSPKVNLFIQGFQANLMNAYYDLESSYGEEAALNFICETLTKEINRFDSSFLINWLTETLQLEIESLRGKYKEAASETERVAFRNQIESLQNIIKTLEEESNDQYQS